MLDLVHLGGESYAGSELLVMRPEVNVSSPGHITRLTFAVISASILVVGLAIMAMLAVPVSGQTGVTVQGQVYDFDSGAGVESATVTLEGHGTTLSAPGGYFRFERVIPATYMLRVEAFGHASERRLLVVDGEETVEVRLEIAPLPLDSLLVERRLVDIKGWVRDPTRDLDLVDADILTAEGEPVWTDSRGRFELEDVLVDDPLRMVVRAFGYVSLDTTVVPKEETEYLFELEPDTVVERLVTAQVARIEERASPIRSVLMRPMNHEQVLEYADGYTLARMLEWEYGSRLRMVVCVLIDEEQLLGAWQPSTLFHILPEQVERVEFLVSPGHKGPYGRAMLRIYTREFMREMISRDVELRRPVFHEGSRPKGFPQLPALCR